MWMTQFVQEVKRVLRDGYGLAPSRTVGNDEPCFDKVPDGIYPMTTEGKIEWVILSDNRFIFGLEVKSPVRAT